MIIGERRVQGIMDEHTLEEIINQEITKAQKHNRIRAAEHTKTHTQAQTAEKNPMGLSCESGTDCI
jgi:hypothetical protein